MNQTKDDQERGRMPCQSPEEEELEPLLKKPVSGRSALREQGVDEALVAQKLKDMLEARVRRWNPKTQTWEEFEDHATQLAAAREIAKMLGLYPREKDGEAENSIMEVFIGRCPQSRRRMPKNLGPQGPTDS